MKQKLITQFFTPNKKYKLINIIPDIPENHIINPITNTNTNPITNISTDNQKVYGYNELTGSWHCMLCGADMGKTNPRQLCRKSYCENTPY